MATFTNAWDETLPLDASLSGISEAGKIDDLIRQMKLDIRERILKFMPVGMVIKWPGLLVPAGFMECRGDSLLRTEYPDLFTVLGTLHGAADSTHFNIPAISGYFLRGWNHGKSTGLYDPDTATRVKTTKTGTTMVDGDHVGTTQGDQNKSHYHEYDFDKCAHKAWGIISHYYGTINTADTGTEARPSNIYFKYIIRVDDENPIDPIYDSRTWDETVPIDSNYMGRMALEVRKLRTDVGAMLNSFFPAGSVIYWPSSSAPDGYLELNGQAISRVTYADLFNEIGDLYGPGDGSTTFNVPDVRGIFIRAHDNDAGIDSCASTRTGGDTVGSEQVGDVKQHNHSYTGTIAGIGNGSGSIPGMFGWDKINDTTETSPLRTIDGHPKNIYLMAIMKAKKVA